MTEKTLPLFPILPEQAEQRKTILYIAEHGYDVADKLSVEYEVLMAWDVDETKRLLKENLESLDCIVLGMRILKSGVSVGVADRLLKRKDESLHTYSRIMREEKKSYKQNEARIKKAEEEMNRLTKNYREILDRYGGIEILKFLKNLLQTKEREIPFVLATYETESLRKSGISEEQRISPCVDAIIKWLKINLVDES